MTNGTPEQEHVNTEAEDRIIKDEVGKEIEEAKQTHTENVLRDKLLRELEQARAAAREVEDAKGQDGRIKEDKKSQAAEVKKTVTRVLKAIKEGIITPPAQSKAVFVNLSNNALGEGTASSLYNLIDKYTNQNVVLSRSGQPKTSFERDFDALVGSDPLSAGYLKDAVKEAARNGEMGGVTVEQIEANLANPHDPRHNERRDREEREKLLSSRDISNEQQNQMIQELINDGMTAQEASEFTRDWIQYYSSFYNKSETNVYNTLKAIYSQKTFARSLKEHLNHIDHIHHDWSPEKKMEHAAEEMETDIVLTVSKLFEQVDKTPPTEFFHEIITQGFMNSIQTAYQNLSRRLGQLTTSAEYGVEDEFLRNFKFTQKYSEEALEAKHQPMSHGEDKRAPQYRVYPLIRVKKEGVTMSDFLSSVGLEVQHEFETRQYLHNVRSMYYRGPDKDGFWPKLAHYAEEMKSTDLDGIMNLPDNNIFMAAYRLYQKFVEDKFASLDWRHAPNMFSKDMGNIYNKIEQDVLEELMKRFPELTESKNNWRARRAMTMAVGLARGVLLTEAETAAWADPHLSNVDGSPSFLSYYTNDNTALNGLNPQHTFLRFFAEQGGKGPLLFLPTSNFEVNPLGTWDHKKLWDNLNKFKKTFLEGRDWTVDGRPNERVLMDILPNIMNVGSIITRHGWRTAPAYEGWYSYKTKTIDGEIRNTSDIHVLKTWKSLENIGYEVLYDFVANGRLPDNLLLAKGSYSGTERDELINYVYRKYINPNVTDATVGDEVAKFLKRVKPDVEKQIDNLIRQGKIPNHEREDAIIKEMYRRILYRSLVGVLQDRIPTKFIRIERDRQTKGGKRAWETLSRKLGLTYDQMDEAMRALAVVETKVRENVSAAMKHHLEGQNDLSTFTGEYKVTEEMIRSILDKEGDGDHRELALKVFRGIRENYFENEAYMDDFSFKIRNKDAAGYATEKVFPFALGTEEVDLSFLAYRASGERLMARAIGDIGAAEADVFKSISEILNQLLPASISEKRDFMPFVNAIKKVQETIQGRINQEWAYKVSYHLASMVIAYYKQDTNARNIFTRWFNLGEKHSLAAEFAGGFSNVWEWDVGTIDKFIFELGRARAIPREPYDLAKGSPDVINHYIDFKLFGKEIKLGKYTTKRKPDFEFSEAKLRHDYGADKKHVAFEMLNTIVPLALLYILWKVLSEAFKELESGGKK